ncbi:MAG: hypothetical protein IPI60_13355 [Saprospiraceae bacterium]|nr:hypothetical protein [Saprospiraceae bacterium]
MKIVALLFSRLLLFAFFQGLIALILFSWFESQKYWILVATITNICSILILRTLLKNKGINLLSIFKFDSTTLKKDLFIFLLLASISIPLVLLPSYYLNIWIYGGSSHYSDIMFQPISKVLVYLLLIAFPLSIAFAELATYFGYLMPLLKTRLKSKTLIVLIPAFFLSIQHCTLPLIFELDFIVFRALVFLPFAVLLGISIFKRPSLFPYFVVFHGLLDAMTVAMLVNNI